MSRIADMPVYQRQEVEVEARIYNLWRRSKLHIPFPIRFSLTGYRGLVMIVDKDEWLCADATQNDMPVLCWLKFIDQGRDALHLPVQCTLNYYHFAAEKIRTQVLELMAEELQRLLDDKNAFIE